MTTSDERWMAARWMAARIDELEGILRDCPLGHSGGRVLAHRGTTEADVVAWLQRVYAAVADPVTTG